MKDSEEKHQRIIDDYSLEKSKHLERQANKMLKNDEHSQKLRTFAVKGDFFDLFN
tara:strand:+ start:633 stop:797 length:165 start_codon:yes stop_codon:yes gene_type:complete